MKLTHNPHASWQRPSAELSADYEDEVRRSTERSERAYRDKEQRLERAEARLRKARSSRRTTRKHLAELVALVELRQTELEDYRRLMVRVAASAEHRGTESFRPVPPTT